MTEAEDTDEKTAGSKELESLKSQLTSAREAEVKRLAEEKTQKRAGRLVEAKELQETGTTRAHTAPPGNHTEDQDKAPGRDARDGDGQGGTEVKIADVETHVRRLAGVRGPSWNRRDGAGDRGEPPE